MGFFTIAAIAAAASHVRNGAQRDAAALEDDRQRQKYQDDADAVAWDAYQQTNAYLERAYREGM